MTAHEKNKDARKQRVRNRNERKIISAAEKVFSTKGYNTATIQEIADIIDIPKANVHYYFPTKKDLYLAVIMNLRDLWKNDAHIMMDESDAKGALSGYVKSLLDLSFNNPHAHKIWSWELMRGAKNLTAEIRQSMIKRHKKETDLINNWIESGQIIQIEPENLLYFIWGITGHFSDLRDQIRILNGNRYLNKEQREKVYHDAVNMVIRAIVIDSKNENAL